MHGNGKAVRSPMKSLQQKKNVAPKMTGFMPNGRNSAVEIGPKRANSGKNSYRFTN